MSASASAAPANGGAGGSRWEAGGQMGTQDRRESLVQEDPESHQAGTQPELERMGKYD